MFVTDGVPKAEIFVKNFHYIENFIVLGDAEKIVDFPKFRF